MFVFPGFLMQTKVRKQVYVATYCLQLKKLEIDIWKILSKQNFTTCLVDKGKVVDLVCLVNGVTCSWLPVKRGIPQGSGLGPVNDLSDELGTSMQDGTKFVGVLICCKVRELCRGIWTTGFMGQCQLYVAQ